MKVAATALVASLFMLGAVPAGAADSPLEHKNIPGASPEPVNEGAGLKSREDLEAFFDGIMAAHLQAQHAAGATLAVVKDGKLFFAKGYGYADLEKRIPVDAEKTLFRPGSTSKLFTWTAVMQLVEQGKLSLDADVNTYLKDFQLPATFAQPVTIRNLMTHTEGFEDGGIGYLFAKTSETSLSLADFLTRHTPTRVRPPTTDFTDGTNSSYSNWGTALAGHIVATVSGMPFDDYVEKNIFAPLGMGSSTFREPLPPDLAPHMSTGYQFKLGAWKAHDFEYAHQIGPAGSLSSTATDMAKFMIAHLQNGAYGSGRILKEETARLMHQRQMSPNPYIAGSGLGFYETWINGRRLIGHAGDVICFHTDLALLPEENVGIFVSYNTGPVLPFSARGDLFKAFMDRYYPAKLPQVKAPEDFKTRAARYAGTYRFIRHSYTKNERMFSLLNDIKIAPTKDNTLVIAVGGNPVASQWVEVAPDTFRELESDRMIAFARNGQGEITHFLGIPLAFITAYKVKWYEGMPLHAFIVGFGVLCFLTAIGSALWNWKADRVAPPPARRARRLAAAVGTLQIGFLGIMLGAVAAAGLDELIYAWPPAFRVALALPLLAIPLTLGVLYFAWRAWKEGYWTRYGRIRYSVIALMSLAFLWSLNFLNLVGYHFG